MNLFSFPKITIEDACGIQRLCRPFAAMGVFNGRSMTFEPNQWAPGVFAGCDFATCYIDGHKFLISSIDLSKRVITVIKLKN